MYLFQPLIVVVNGFGMIFSLISLFTTFAQVQVTIQSIGYGIVVFILLYLSIVFVIMEGKFTRNIAKYIFSLPVYNLTWVPIISRDSWTGIIQNGTILYMSGHFLFLILSVSTNKFLT